MTDEQLGELMRVIRYLRSITTYPQDDDNNRRLYDACVELETAGRLRRRELGDGVVLFVPVEDAE